MAIKFDDGSANAFKKTLESTMKEVINELTKMEREVETCQSWWKGGSEKGFINSFKKTKVTIEGELKKCAKNYQDLVDEVKKDKKREEDEMKSALEKIEK